MKIVSFGPRGADQPGLLLGDEVLPLLPALNEAGLMGAPHNALLALWPVLFLKPPSAIAGPFDAVVKPLETPDMEPELEIAVVIGKAGRRVPQACAMDHVLGFMIGNDITARDVFVGESPRSTLFCRPRAARVSLAFAPPGLGC